MNYLLSIIVPTKDRYYNLKYLVEYFHGLDFPHTELIIQDNSKSGREQLKFSEFLKSLKDQRIVYSYTAEHLSVIENSDRALLNATGYYISFIGDDDIFSKHIFQLLIEAKEKGVDAVLPAKGSYTWPDVQSKLYGSYLSGKLILRPISDNATFLGVEALLANVLRLGGTEMKNLPRLYHGIVRRAILDKIWARSGSYFPGPSPDMANAIALCKYVKQYVYTGIPYIISGHSALSAGGMGAKGTHIGEIENFKHLPKDTADKWSTTVPFYWSGTTIYAESLIQALVRMDMVGWMEHFNFNYLYATCLVFDRGFSKRVHKTIRETKKTNRSISYYNIYLYYLAIWGRRVNHHLRKNIILLFPSSLKRNQVVYFKSNTKEVASLNDDMIEKYLNGKPFFS
jgi:glycosyltransferase involved in cell wall biosynthesis